MSNKSEARGTYRVVEPKWKFVVDQEFDCHLTFWECVKLLFGYKLKVKYESPVAHSPGQMKPKLMVAVVNEH